MTARTKESGGTPKKKTEWKVGKICSKQHRGGITPVISVIIPVYNVAPYLREALNSVVNQTYYSLEILVIDDGSTDGSGSICDEYKTDSRVTVIQQPNRGLSNARNTGLDAATGDFIAFLDPDDAWHLSFIEELFFAITDADIVVSRYTINQAVGVYRFHTGNITGNALPGFIIANLKSKEDIYQRAMKAGLLDDPKEWHYRNMSITAGYYLEGTQNRTKKDILVWKWMKDHLDRKDYYRFVARVIKARIRHKMYRKFRARYKT